MGTDRAEWAKVCTDLMNIRHSVKRQQQPVDVKNPLQISDIYSTLPSPELCGILFDNYMRTFERIHRIVDIPRFSEQYDQFWDDPSQFSNKVSVIFILVYSSSSTTIPLEKEGGLSSRKSATLYASKYYICFGFPTNSHMSMPGFLLVPRNHKTSTLRL